MGNMHAQEYASGEFCDFDTGLVAHLQSNHYPPIPLVNMPPAKEAISAILRGEFDAGIYVPTADREIPAQDVIEGMHLWAFVESAFYAQEWPCQHCFEIWGDLDCGTCPVTARDNAIPENAS